jgi:glycosyltransferase involved in cell wall biosynthesis
MAGSNVQFIGAVDEVQAGDLLDRCAAFLFCAEDDFGIAPLEANAHGAPVVALRAGAILETMQEGETAIFFDEPTEEALAVAVRRALTHPWDESVLRANASRFSPERFRSEFSAAVTAALSGAPW